MCWVYTLDKQSPEIILWAFSFDCQQDCQLSLHFDLTNEVVKLVSCGNFMHDIFAKQTLALQTNRLVACLDVHHSVRWPAVAFLAISHTNHCVAPFDSDFEPFWLSWPYKEDWLLHLGFCCRKSCENKCGVQYRLTTNYFYCCLLSWFSK